ncbi:hypothetical protein EV677_2244 [Herminiimonas fonticola]|uniref:Uncharacterized protein n=1 Tax=Herminiimonas fonticola TaxID=303380 RepID=A0A4V3BVC6_9BURK|nr:hypothetical protein EV677_2244 [Herminiimonas fonticola]
MKIKHSGFYECDRFRSTHAIALCKVDVDLHRKLTHVWSEPLVLDHKSKMPLPDCLIPDYPR